MINNVFQKIGFKSRTVFLNVYVQHTMEPLFQVAPFGQDWYQKGVGVLWGMTSICSSAFGPNWDKLSWMPIEILFQNYQQKVVF